jgi:hypothetical protein
MRPTPEQQRNLDSRYYHTGLEDMGIGLNHEPTDPRTDHIPYDITTPITPPIGLNSTGE